MEIFEQIIVTITFIVLSLILIIVGIVAYFGVPIIVAILFSWLILVILYFTWGGYNVMYNYPISNLFFYIGEKIRGNK